MKATYSTDSGYVFAAVTLLIWSGFVVVSRLGSTSILTPYDIAALRLGTAALVLAPWWLPRLLNRERRQLKWYQALSLALLAGITYPLASYIGFQTSPASHGAVLISGMLPFFTSFFAGWLLGERPSRVRVLGLVLILTGVLTLLFGQITPQTFSTATIKGDFMLLSASCLWSLFTVLIKYWQLKAFDVSLGVTSVSAMIYLPVFALFLPSHLHLASVEDIALQAFYQGFIVVCVAMWTYAKAVELLGSVKVVIMMSAVPVVGALLAVPVLGETLSSSTALGVTIVFLGALIGAMAKPPKQA